MGRAADDRGQGALDHVPQAKREPIPCVGILGLDLEQWTAAGLVAEVGAGGIVMW
jgi:hypothetical protein